MEFEGSFKRQPDLKEGDVVECIGYPEGYPTWHYQLGKWYVLVSGTSELCVEVDGVYKTGHSGIWRVVKDVSFKPKGFAGWIRSLEDGLS